MTKEIKDGVQTKLLTAQDIFEEWPGGEYAGGFNMRVSGWTHLEANGYPAYPSPARETGYSHAARLIKEGKIYYRHRFHHKGCKGYAFPYGGAWVCNDCGRSGVNEPWWEVKVMQDGNAWICLGLGFENLQLSDNFAYGDTREEAVQNYEKLMLKAREKTDD